MEIESSNGDDLQTLLEAIKASELVETRIQLLTKLGISIPPDNPDLDALLEFLVTLWEGFTCLDVSQCMLNKAILDVAAKYLEGDNSRCQGKFLTMGTEASKWCAKHLKMTLMSTGDSQEEEHCSFFFKLLLVCLKFSVACFSLVVRSPTLGDELLMVALDKFTMEQLNLIKDLVSEIKKIQSFSSELLKGAETVLDSAMKLCKVYSQAVNWDLYDQVIRKDSSSLNSVGEGDLNHVAKIIKCTIEKLSDLGTLAADGGGSLVTILNLSWKGVVSLLQLGRGTLAGKVNVGEIIMILISLAMDSLRCAAEAWSSSHDKAISVTEAKRAFLPIKFYLINAVRISSQYPQQAFSVYQEISLCIIQLTTLRVTLSKDMVLKNVCEAVEELLKPTSLHLLKSLLNSAQLNKNQKLQILDWLFGVDSDEVTDFRQACLDEIFSVTCEAMPRARTLLLGRITLFIDLLKVSFDLDEDVLHGMTRMLQWFLDFLVDEEVYSSALVVKIPASFGDGKTSVVTWEPILFSFLHALKTFMILVSKSQAWSEVEWFLLDNFFHPHFLCWEIIVELWCFLVRHAESNTVNVIMDKLCSLYKLVACSDSHVSVHGALRRMARSMCLLLASCTPSTVDRVYRSIVTDERSHLSAVMHAALFMEGFQLNLLSENLRTAAIERIFNGYIHFVDDYTENSTNFGSSDVFGVQVVVLCSALQSMQIDASCVDKKTLKFLLATIQTYKRSTDRVIKNHCCRLLSEALGIISTAKHLYSNDQIEQVITELENMFISGPTKRESELHKCKPALASFMASMGHMEMPECEESVKTCTVWQLYHMLLSERHWALIHLAISAFGYFAARTSCNQLWRFVPPNAALSFDPESGNKNANEERFMSELKVFLEKEMALPAAAASSSEQLDMVFKDGLILKEQFQKNSYVGCEALESGGEEVSNKRRKLPDGFSRGMELLQNGLKVMGDGLSLWKEDEHDYAELDDKILTEFSCLEDMVKNLVGLADSR